MKTLHETAGEIATAYLAANQMEAREVPGFIQEILNALGGQGTTATPASDTNRQDSQRKMPTQTEIRNSIQPDGLISFLDGRKYKTIKRHLGTHGMSPEQYRERFGLPVDYPMVCADYSEVRSGLAKQLGLGTTGRGGRRKNKATVDAPAPTARRKRGGQKGNDNATRGRK